MEAFKVIVATFGKTQKPNTIISSEMRILPALYLLQRDNSITFFGDCQGFKIEKVNKGETMSVASLLSDKLGNKDFSSS